MAASTGPLALELRGVYQHVAGRQALVNLDLQLDTGDWLLVVGPNSAGKTLLMRLLLGLDAPSAGAVRLLGADWNAPGARALRRRVGAVLQGGSLLTDATVLDNLLLPLRDDPRPAPERARLAGLAMTLFQLDGLEHHWPGQLSLGQRRQVELARALVHWPECLVWDGLTEGLDRVTLRQTLQTLGELRHHRGLTLIATAYDPQALAGIEHRLAVLDQGRLLFFGAPESLVRACRADAQLRATLHGIDAVFADTDPALSKSVALAATPPID